MHHKKNKILTVFVSKVGGGISEYVLYVFNNV